MQRDNGEPFSSPLDNIEANRKFGIGRTGQNNNSSDSLATSNASNNSPPKVRSRSRSNASIHSNSDSTNHMDPASLSALQEKIIAFQEARLGKSTPTSPVENHGNLNSYMSPSLSEVLINDNASNSKHGKNIDVKTPYNNTNNMSRNMANYQNFDDPNKNVDANEFSDIKGQSVPVSQKSFNISDLTSSPDLQRNQLSNVKNIIVDQSDKKSHNLPENVQDQATKKSDGVVNNINDLNTINRMNRLAQKMAALSTNQQQQVNNNYAKNNPNHPLSYLPVNSSQYSFLTNADNKPLTDSSFWKNQQQLLQQRTSAAAKARSSAAQPQFSLLQQQQFQHLHQLQKNTANDFSAQPPLPSFPIKPTQSRQQVKSSPVLSLAARRKNKFSGSLSLSDIDNSDQAKQLPLGSKTDSIACKNSTENGLTLQENETNSFSNFNKYIDIKNGKLNFNNKASIHSHGVDFSSGKSFEISTNDMEVMGELGRGNYGTVTKALHKPTKIILAMKEVKLALDDAKLRQIAMELDILHKCESPFIVDFFGAFFIEGAVYMCIEYMDGGSLDQIYLGGIEEKKLAYITECVVHGLKDLKDNHNIIHRDVKPTNILVNTQGKVKLCDFGVSGNLVASKANTNIGCQSYMPPERITSDLNHDTSYTVQSDVWSLGITIIETGLGKFPYPRADSIMDQLNFIVYGESPRLPKTDFSEMAISFVKSCLHKKPEDRPNYSDLLSATWLSYARDNWFGVDYEDMQAEFADFIKDRVQKNKTRNTLNY